MKKYICVIAVVILVFSLSGCANIAEPIVSDPTQTVNEEISKETPAAQADEPDVSSDSTESTVEPDKKAEIPETEAEPGSEKPSAETVRPQETPAAQSQEAEKPTQQGTTPTSKPAEPPKQADPKPSEQPKAQETKPPATSEPTTPETKPEPTPPAETEPPAETPPAVTEPVEPAFNINDWIAYAQSYATSVGLRLESSAVECWDNPITAGAHSLYLERDIQSRLNRYAKDEDITDVWIWAQSRSDGSYDLYIGYA